MTNILALLASKKQRLDNYIKSSGGNLGQVIDTIKNGQDNNEKNDIKDLFNDFHENVNKDFKDKKVKKKILSNEKDINALTKDPSNEKAIEPILLNQFLDDLNKAIESTTNDDEISPENEELLVNELNLLNRVKENIRNKNDSKHSDLVEDAMNILTKKSNYVNPLLDACKFVNDYISDNDLYKHAEEKLNEDFVDDLFKVQMNYLNNPEITNEIDNILSKIALRNPKLRDYMGSGKFGNYLNQIDNNSSRLDSLLKEFHENVQKDFKDKENKDKVLDNEEGINKLTKKIKDLEPLLTHQFIDDLNKAVD